MTRRQQGEPNWIQDSMLLNFKRFHDEKRVGPVPGVHHQQYEWQHIVLYPIYSPKKGNPKRLCKIGTRAMETELSFKHFKITLFTSHLLRSFTNNRFVVKLPQIEEPLPTKKLDTRSSSSFLNSKTHHHQCFHHLQGSKRKSRRRRPGVPPLCVVRSSKRSKAWAKSRWK